MVSVQLMLSSLYLYLQEQHVGDLILYQSAHQHDYNRVLHWILIPVETFCSFWILATILPHLLLDRRNNNNNKNFISSSDLIIHALGWTMGITSLFLATTTTTTTRITEEATDTDDATTYSARQTRSRRHLTLLLSIGVAACLLYIFLAAASLAIVQYFAATAAATESTTTKMSLMYATTAWTVAWILQIGIGHYGWEGNSPNVVANVDEVSVLAVMTSILIAWKS
jgi:uncharacterized membrane protein YGL010W